MNDNEYSATKILGWELKANTTSCLPYYGGPHGRTPVHCWHPDKLRDQLWLVLEKCNFSLRLAAEKVIHGEDSRVSIYAHGMIQPAVALEAICKAHAELSAVEGVEKT